ncbi:MAG: peptidoglycan-binding protein [Proteobacteria bacterium]|nr:peptidoglycan-binding protein [Pseudomonadota bacterium]
MIAAWQKARNKQPTGFLDGDQQQMLTKEAAAAVEKYDAQQKAIEDEKRLFLSDDSRRLVQVALTSLGFDTRDQSGEFGPRTREMIAAWQKSRQLPETGYLDETQKLKLDGEGAPGIARFNSEQQKSKDEKKAEMAAVGLSGAWYGKLLDNWTADTDRRDLVVVDETTCRWDLPKQGGPGFAMSCKIDGAAGTIDLVTGAGSAVKLRRNGANLEGTLRLKDGGKTYRVVFQREPFAPASTGSSAQSLPHGTWRGDIQAFRYGEASRELAIYGIGFCRWGFVRNTPPPSARACAFDEASRRLTLTASDRSIVRLELKGDVWDGSIELIDPSGQSPVHQIVMKRVQ